MLQMYKMTRWVSINGGEFYKVGEAKYSFKKEDEEHLRPVQGTLTFDKLFNYKDSDWFYAGHTSIRKKKYIMIESVKYRNAYDKYTEETLKEIAVKNTFEIYNPTLNELMHWKPVDEVITYLKDRGLTLN